MADDLMFDCDAIKSDTSVDSHANQSVDSADSPLDREDDKNVNSELLENDSSSSNHSALESDFLLIEGNSASSLVEKLVEPAEEMRDENAAARIVGTKTKNKTKKTDVVSKIDSGVKSRSTKAVSKESTILKEEKKTVAVKKSPALTGTKKVDKTANETLKDTKSKAAPATKLPAEKQIVEKSLAVKTKTTNSASKPISSSQNTARSTSASRPISAKSASSSKPAPKKPVSPKQNTSTSVSAVGAVSSSTPSTKSTSATKTTSTKPSSTKLTSPTKAKLQQKPSTATSSSPQKGIPTKPSTSRSPSAAKPTSSKLDGPKSSSAPKPVSARPNPIKSVPIATSTKPNTVRSTSAAKKSSPETKPERSKSATRATPSRPATGSKLEKSTPATKVTPPRSTIGSKPERSTSATRKTPSRPTTGSKSIPPRPNDTKPGVKSKSASSAASTSKTKSTSEKLPSPKAKSNPTSAKNVSARPVKKTQEASKEKPAASPRIRKKITPPKSDKSKYDEKGKEAGIGTTPPKLGNENENQEVPCPLIAGSNESPAIDEVESSKDSLETKLLLTSDTVKDHANIEPCDEIHTGTSSERISENDSDSIKTDSILSESDVRNELRGLEGEASGKCDKDSEETNNSMNRDLNHDMDDRTEDHEVLSPEFNKNVKREFRDDTTTEKCQDSAGISDEMHVEIEDRLSFEASKDSRVEISGDISSDVSGENCSDGAYIEYKQENTKKSEKDTDLVMNPKTELEIVNAADAIFHETTIKDKFNSEVHQETEDIMEDGEGMLASHDSEDTIEEGATLKECFEREDEQEKNSTSDICKSQKDVIEESVEVRQDHESKTENDLGISTGQEEERNKETESVNEEGDSNMNTTGENVFKKESDEMIDVCSNSQDSNKHNEPLDSHQQGDIRTKESFLDMESEDRIESSFDTSPTIEIERKIDPVLNTSQDAADENENHLIVVECLDSKQGIDEESKESKESEIESHLSLDAVIESKNDSPVLYNRSEEKNEDDREMNEETKFDGTFEVSQDVATTTENTVTLDGYQETNEQSDPALDVSQDPSTSNKINENLNANQEATNTDYDSLIIGGYQKAENQSKVGLSLHVSQEEEGKNGYNLILDGGNEGGNTNESIFQADEEKNEALEKTEKSIQDLEPKMEDETTENLVQSSDARETLLHDNEPDQMGAILQSQNDKDDIHDIDEKDKVKNYEDAFLDGHHSDNTPPSTPIEDDFAAIETIPDCLPDVSFIGASFFQPQDQMNQCDNDLWMSVASTNTSKYNEGLNVLEMCQQDLGQTKEYVSPLDVFEHEQMNFSDLDTPMSDVAVCNGEDYQDLSSTDDEGTSGVAYFHDNFQIDSPGASGAVTKNHGEVLVIEDETARVANFSESEEFFPMSHNIGQSDIDSAPYENSSKVSWENAHQLDSNTEGSWNNHQVYMISQGGGNFSQSYGLAHSVTQLPFVTKDKNSGDPV